MNLIVKILSEALNVDDAKKNIPSLIEDDGKLRIFRAIRVSDDWFDKIAQEDIITLGIYWTWSRDSAYAHWAKDKKQTMLIIEGKVYEDCIDWESTLWHNTKSEYELEKEIRLIERSEIEVVSMQEDGYRDKLDISILEGKTFVA